VQLLRGAGNGRRVPAPPRGGGGASKDWIRSAVTNRIRSAVANRIRSAVANRIRSAVNRITVGRILRMPLWFGYRRPLAGCLPDVRMRRWRSGSPRSL
jgi:hypothetical protein